MSKQQRKQNSQTLSSDLVAVHLGGCLTPEQIAAGVAGTLNQIDQDTVMAHLAACADCSTEYNLLLLGSKAAPKPTLFGHGRWHWWLLAAAVVVAVIVAVPLLLNSGNRHEAASAPPKTVTSAPATVSSQPQQTAQNQQNPTPPRTAPVTQTGQAPSVQPAPAAKAATAKPADSKPALPIATVPAPAVTAEPAEPVSGQKSLQLMTAAEAALPASTQVGLAGVSVDDGPIIIIDKPSDGATVANGFPLYILYEAVGRETIDTSTVKLVCRKQPQVNLTSRIKPYIGEKGIWIESVRLPPGQYRLRLSLADSQGRTAERGFSLTVTGQPQR